MSEQQQIEKGLKHLEGSEEIIGNIVAYCVNAHKADPSTKTMNKIRQYVSDTANSVCGHVLTIAHNINSIIDKETKEIQDMQYRANYIQHRLKSNQSYMSQLYMTKFQIAPRPKKPIHILRETVPNDKLPRFARPKKKWIRKIDYSVLDKLYDRNGTQRTQNNNISYAGPPGSEGNNTMSQEEKTQKALNTVQPKAAVQPLNIYEQSQQQPKLDSSSTASKSNNLSLYQQDKDAKLKKGTSKKDVNVATPPPAFSAAPPTFSAATSNSSGPPPVPPVPPVPPKPPQ